MQEIGDKMSDGQQMQEEEEEEYGEEEAWANSTKVHYYNHMAEATNINAEISIINKNTYWI